MAKVGSGTIVAALTVAALAGIGVLAWQADAAQHAGTPAATSSARPGPHRGTPPGVAAARKRELALPAASGTGRRVVYALARHRVWLVGANGTVERTYPVVAGTVAPRPGVYDVTGRTAAITGTDGVPIEHVVLFSSSDGTVIGFSAAVDGSLPTPDPAKHTGGIREHLADGAAMWGFAAEHTKVVVVA